MTADQYRRWSGWWREHERAAKVLCEVDTAFKYLGYLMYPLLLVFVALAWPERLVAFVAIPFVGFVAVSVFRHFYKAPRPYESLDIERLIHKETQGHSMPSRHVFSLCIIAVSWLWFCLPVGAALLFATAVMSYVRVIGGVHFPRDVIAGVLVALIFGSLGYSLVF